MKKRGAIAILICVLIPLGLVIFAFAACFHVMLPSRDISVSDPDAHAYRMDENYVLLVWQNDPFIIYPADRWVGQPSDYRNRVMGRNFWPIESSLVFWPRGSYASVPVGDAVKGDRREKFEFTGNKVRILAFFSPPQAHGSEITVELPKEFRDNG